MEYNKKHMKRYISLAIIAIVTMCVLFVPAKVYAADTLNCSILPADICKAATSKPDKNGDISSTGTFKLLIWVINILTALIGIIAVGVLVYAGIMYASAGDNSQQISSAKGMITNTVIGIVAYGLMYFALNWLIPGGLIG